MISTGEVLPNKKLRIKFASKITEAGPASSTSAKRGPPAGIEDQQVKRQRMDHSVKQQCSNILKKLMTHPAGWVFNQPVDPEALNIPDYFSIISNPMDLGTIKSKLDNNLYFSNEEFVADVRLTFSNAMQYNPASNSVHMMAKELNNIFEVRWKSVEPKMKCGSLKVKQGQLSSGSTKRTCISRQIYQKSPPLHNDFLSKKMSVEEKQKLRKELEKVLRGKIPLQLQSVLRRFGFIIESQGSIEMDIDAFDNKILWQLKKLTTNYSKTGAAEVEYSKVAENKRNKPLKKSIQKGLGSDNRHACDLVIEKSPLSQGSGTCQCSLQVQGDSMHASSSDLSSEKPVSKDYHTIYGDAIKQRKQTLVSGVSKSDQDSDGVVHALDEGNNCLSSHLAVSTTDTASTTGWFTPLFDCPTSPKKALRAAMLKRRFADTILKAQQQTHLVHVDKTEHVKKQLEREIIERKLCEAVRKFIFFPVKRRDIL
ncbi:transcription factor GTE10-like isoform X2 [Malania oleifera]|uniref:transcription factor GTE10-like isoform X2 n=1 Tax=Malania oleifera TaxID=397392 RepID=UPI0025AE7F0D|nr:transcription factor GTE10-like isoform X2 [Malania oleifera]